MSERIGLYGGSFDPVHFGHLNLAIEMLEKYALSKIYFCPAALSPFKQEIEPAASHHRLAMLKYAIEEIPEFSILENELLRPPPSFTIDTIEELLIADQKKTLNQHPEYFLILGEDSAVSFPSWYRAEEIIKKVKILIGCRSCPKLAFKGNADMQKAIERGITITPIFDISSTEIRKRIQHKSRSSHRRADGFPSRTRGSQD